MAIYGLGDFQFITLHRTDGMDAPPEICSEQTVPVERPGVDGAGILRTGRRGKQFQMISGVDVASRDDVDILIEAYDDMVGRERFNMMWADTNYTAEHLTTYVVLAVTVTRVKLLSAMAGGLSGATAGFWVEALWTLLPVPSE